MTTWTNIITGVSDVEQPDIATALVNGVALETALAAKVDVGGDASTNTVIATAGATKTLAAWAHEIEQHETGKLAIGGDASASQVTPSNGTAPVTLASFTGRILFPEAFGATGNGTTDDVAHLQAAIDALYARGGGVLSLKPDAKYLIDSADLVLRQGVAVVGNWSAGGQRSGQDYTGMPGLIVNSARTVRMLRNSSLVGVPVRRKGLTAPTSYRTAIAELAAYAGTAITLGDVGDVGESGSDTTVDSCFVIGFQYGLRSVNQSRMRIARLHGDCTNGVYISECNDTGRIQGAHFWPFLNAQSAWSYTSYTITGAANNGAGLVRLTVVGHPFVSGDTVYVSDIGGTTEAKGRWTATVVDGSHIDLQGSTFANAFTTNGTIWAVSGIRSGTGIYIQGSDVFEVSDTVVYGYTINYHIGDQSTSTLLTNIGSDFNAAFGDNQSIGVKIANGSFLTTISNAFITGSGTAVSHEGTTLYQSTFVGCSIGGAVVRSLDMQAGVVSIVGGHMDGTVYVRSAANHLSMLGTDSLSVTLSGDTDADVQKAVFIGDRAPSGAGKARLVGGGVSLGTVASKASGIVERLSISSGGTITAPTGFPLSLGSGTLASITSSAHTLTTNNDSSGIALALQRTANSSAPTRLNFDRTRGAVAQVSDTIAEMNFRGFDGSNFATAAQITVTVDSTPGTNSMPGRINFNTVAAAGTTALTRMSIDNAGIVRPGADNTQALGSGSFRWSQLYAGTSTINTSDARLKVIRGPLTDAERRVARRVAGMVQVFQMADAVAQKGAAARLHVGWIAQELAAAFQDEGLDPAAYALWCADPEMEVVEETVSVEVPVLQRVSVPVERIEIRDGMAVLVRTEEERDEPVTDALPLIGEDGSPVLDEDGAPRTVLVPRLTTANETRRVERPVLDADGNPVMRLGLRYEQILAFVLAGAA